MSGVTEAQITAFLDAQPFAKSRNQSTRMWELFSNTDPTFLREVVAAALSALSLPSSEAGEAVACALSEDECKALGRIELSAEPLSDEHLLTIAVRRLANRRAAWNKARPAASPAGTTDVPSGSEALPAGQGDAVRGVASHLRFLASCEAYDNALVRDPIQGREHLRSLADQQDPRHD